MNFLQNFKDNCKTIFYNRCNIFLSKCKFLLPSYRFKFFLTYLSKFAKFQVLFVRNVCNRNRFSKFLLEKCESFVGTRNLFLEKKDEKETLKPDEILGPIEDFEKIQNTKTKIPKKKATKNLKTQFTHFLSIPTNQDSVQKMFVDFKTEVLAKPESTNFENGITESLFQKPERLHLTLGMMSLEDENQLEFALQVLQCCSREIINPFLEEKGPIKIKVKGIESMNKNLKRSRVLYAKVCDEFGHLQEISDKIVSYFIEKGVMEREHDSVKLHITLLNSIFRKGRQKKEKTPFLFNVENIVKDHEETYFGEINVESVHISERRKFDDNGYYLASGIARFVSKENN